MGKALDTAQLWRKEQPSPCSWVGLGVSFVEHLLPHRNELGGEAGGVCSFFPACRNWLLICVKLFFLPLFPLSKPFSSLSRFGEGQSPWGRCWTQLSFGEEFCFFPCCCCGVSGAAGVALSLPGTVSPAPWLVLMMIFPHFLLWLWAGGARAVPELSHPARRILPPLS